MDAPPAPMCPATPHRPDLPPSTVPWPPAAYPALAHGVPRRCHAPPTALSRQPSPPPSLPAAAASPTPLPSPSTCPVPVPPASSSPAHRLPVTHPSAPDAATSPAPAPPRRCARLVCPAPAAPTHPSATLLLARSAHAWSVSARRRLSAWGMRAAPPPASPGRPEPRQPPPASPAPQRLAALAMSRGPTRERPPALAHARPTLLPASPSP